MICMKKAQAEFIDETIEWVQANCCACDVVSAASGIASIYDPKRMIKIIRFLIRMDFISLIKYYQAEIDPQMKRKLHVKRICRYHPTCSNYTKAAITKYGSFVGIVKGAFRILRCNPFSKGGYDPV